MSKNPGTICQHKAQWDRLEGALGGQQTWFTTTSVFKIAKIVSGIQLISCFDLTVFWLNSTETVFKGKQNRPIRLIRFTLICLILNPLWHQVLAPKTRVKYLKESEIVITTNNNFFKVIFGILTLIIISFSDFVHVFIFLLLHEKFLQSDWFRGVVFQLNLKYLHVKITNVLRVVV